MKLIERIIYASGTRYFHCITSNCQWPITDKHFENFLETSFSDFACHRWLRK